MIVRSIKTSIAKRNRFVTNGNLDDYMEVGTVYEVYGIRISNDSRTPRGMVYFMIFDGNHLIEVPSELFEIIGGRVSSLWEMRFQEDTDVTFWPTLFYDEDFIENFSEYEKKERNEFAKLRQLFHEYEINS